MKGFVGFVLSQVTAGEHGQLVVTSSLGNCDDGTSHCADANPICCFQGGVIQFCCTTTYPICDLANHQCISNFEVDVAWLGSPSTSPTLSTPGVAPARSEEEPEHQVSVGNCDDGTSHCADANPICCFDHGVIQFCCTTTYPICDLVNQNCHSNFEVDVAKLGAPVDTPILSSPGMAPAPIAEEEQQLSVGNCDDGTSHCADANPICCFQGGVIQFCCTTTYPICDLANHQCISNFEVDVARLGSPSATAKLSTAGVAPVPVEETDEHQVSVGNCDDGTSHCADANPICCFDHGVIQFCCTTTYPICDLVNQNCHSNFEVDVAKLGSLADAPTVSIPGATPAGAPVLV